MSRIKGEQPAGLSSGEGCLAEDGVPFFRPFSGEAGFVGDEVFRRRLPAVSTASPELRPCLQHHSVPKPKKISKNAEK
jgi:hypothetical protein